MSDVQTSFESIKALIVDPRAESRAMATELLRAAGIRTFMTAEAGPEAMTVIKQGSPDLIVMEWLEGPMDALAFIQAVRRTADAANRATPIVLLTPRNRARDVEAARAAGADAYLTKPISMRTAKEKLAVLFAHPRPFVDTAHYVGPCRRRTPANADYLGPRRRITDAPLVQEIDPALEATQLNMRREQAERVHQCALRLKPGDLDDARALFAEAQSLADIADVIGDKMLLMGAKQMVRYLESLGAAALDGEVVRTHAEALFQLADLPNAKDSERRAVARSLEVMVEKKLRAPLGG